MAGKLKYNKVLELSMEFATALKVLPTEGNLVYEYNPFYNYRVTETSYTYNGRLYSPYELFIELGGEKEMYVTPKDATTPDDNVKLLFEVTDDDSAEIFFAEFDDWEDLQERTYPPTKITIPTDKDDPILREVGDLVDFDTDELQFDINHPVEIAPSYSYDNSVDLIINDGKNVPRLINSRFSATLRNRYQIVDRKGNNDTNIYDQGDQFDIDTSLYKRVIEIPVLSLTNIGVGGCLPVGNYFFYFRYTDADGNETDFVAESGLVSIFIGSSPAVAHTGFVDEDSHKLVRFMLKNIDSAYSYVQIYYTRSTADVNVNASTAAYRIDQKYIVNAENNCDITITGYEVTTLVDVSEVNPVYLIASSIETQALCLNMLFIGNITKPNIPYQELSDCALRFKPYITKKDYECTLSLSYTVETASMGYYDPMYIYRSVGYWNHEIYRFGVVFILSDCTLSPVFNVRGAENIATDEANSWSDIPFWTDEEKTLRNYISVDEETFLIAHDANLNIDISFSTKGLENAKGVISIDMPIEEDKHQVYGINFQIEREALDYLSSEYNIKGFFIVRQKRIPTTLALAYMIGIDSLSYTPILPVYPTEHVDKKQDYVAESFINSKKIITHTLGDRLYTFESPGMVRTQGAICPEYDVDMPYFNQLFTGDEFTVVDSDLLPRNPYLTQSDRHFYVRQDEYEKNTSIGTYNTRIVGVQDGVTLMGIGDDLFAARAGEAEEGFRFEYLEKENKIEDATNVIRGEFGPYLGITGYEHAGKMIDIKIPGYDQISLESLFRIRYNDKASFYAVSERVDMKNLSNLIKNDYTYNDQNIEEEVKHVSFITDLYRGDCYICQFTHRLNRNFQDPAAPTNDEIVDPNCWRDHFVMDDGVIDYEEFEEVNLGDLNAVKMGLWVTFTIRSTKNLNVRSIDDSYVDEAALTGHPRGYYPYNSMLADGPYKTPEALCYNKAFESSVGERYNFEQPDVPAIKNDFSNRIAYSDIHVNDAFKNGYRVFQARHYRDYSKEYGGIMKILEFGGNIICVFEHGIARLEVNKQALKTEQDSGEVYLASDTVIPLDPVVISNVYGSQWRDSVIATDVGVYGVDTVARKIWRTDGRQLQFISDNVVGEFLNNNISLTERELEPIIGIRDVKTHYNRYKDDVMFTFYDNLYGFEECVWNLCFNQTLQQFSTFYSWLPSYSENIYNQYFSFDRNTSKWISKLGVSHHDNSFADGVCLSNNTITLDDVVNEYGWSTKLWLDNRTLPSGDGITVAISYSIEHDIYGNHKLFYIQNGVRVIKGTTMPYDGDDEDTLTEYISLLYFTGGYSLDDYKELSTDDKINLYKSITSELYERMTDPDNAGKIVKDDRGRRIWLDVDDPNRKNPDKLVRLLNIRASILVAYDGVDNQELADAYCQGFTNTMFVDAGYYDSVVAVIPEYNFLFLTTDFWKHGKAGIIDISDTINPAYWYGKQHPFEFEFVINSDLAAHKIFDFFLIISNNVPPESFHFEIVGDCFTFANDKKNMYIRQEATKELYQYNGIDTTYDHGYTDLTQQLRESGVEGIYDRSTLLPLYYSRQDTINEIEDYYHLKDGANTRNFEARSGGEIVKYDNLDEYRLWSHVKAVDMRDSGRLYGNMQYKEDRWSILISPLDIVQANEPKWPSSLVPVEIGQSPLPNEILDRDDPELEMPDGMSLDGSNGTRAIVSWNWIENNVSEVKLKDKWIKIRIRYKGDLLVVIHNVDTWYSISES